MLTIKEVSVKDRMLRVLIEAAVLDPDLGPIVRRRLVVTATAFYVGNEMVGFAIPRKDADGIYRTGPIYVLPKHRKKGYAKAFVKEYFKGRKGRAYIDVNNMASQSLFRSCGFRKSGRKTIPSNEVYEEWVWDPKIPASSKW